MRNIIVAALAAVCFSASAETRIATNGPDSVRLTLDVCTAEPVLAMIPEIYRNVVRDGISFTGGREWHICWFVDGENAHLLYEDGDQGMIPMAAFKKMRDA